MFDMVFAIEGRDVGASQSTTTLMAEEIEPSEIISLTQWVLSTTIFSVDGEELGSNDFSAVLSNISNDQQIEYSKPISRIKTYMTFEAFQMERPV